MEDYSKRLRERAKDELRKGKKIDTSLYETDLKVLVEELSIYQIELEHQNQELIQSQDLIQQSKDRYLDLFDNAPVGYLIVDKNGVIKDINKTACLLLDSSKHELVKNKISKIIHKDFQDTYYVYFRTLINQEHNQTCIIKLRKSNNAFFYARIQGIRQSQLIPDDPEFRLAIIDVSLQKAMEQKLLTAKDKAEESDKLQRFQNDEIEFHNERLESLLRISQFHTNSIQELLDFALSEAINLTESKIGYIYFYDEAKQQFTLNTWSKEVMKECSVRNPQTVYDLDKTGCWGEAVRQRKPIVMNDYQAENPHKGGIPEGHIQLSKFLTIPVIVDDRIVAVAGLANKETDYDNSDIRQLTLLMDSVWKISERIILIKDLTIAKQRAEESDRLKSAFLANMSHEIRTPMNGILGFAELLKKPDLSGEDQQDYIRIIEKSGVRMLNIINDIVDISKIEAGLMKLNIQETNINEQIEFIYTFFKPEVEAKGMKLSFSTPLTAKEASISTDREKVYAILTNLVKNAIKYSKEGSIEIGYTIADTQGIAYLRFYVKDTGIGIPKDRQEAIFERFIQAEISDRMAIQGAGLGLSITKAYVEMLGGEIWVESNPNPNSKPDSLRNREGAGSTFYFTLPYGTDPLKERADQQQEPSDKTYQIRKLKILIAEDDEISKMLMGKTLNVFGKHILKANNGREAVDACQKNPDIDLVLMDIQMPEMGGHEATRQIREFNKEVVIIAQTAYGISGDREKAIEAGCNDYISKPINVDILFALILKYFKG